VIGRVTATVKGREIVATLGDDGRWACPADPGIADLLNALHDPRPGYSPADGRFGVAQVHRAAATLGGTAEIGPRDPGPPGRIY
jgi:hypothetical protein